MRRALVLFLVAVVPLGRLDGQDSASSPPRGQKHWSFSLALGPIAAASGGGVHRMFPTTSEFAVALRRHVRNGRWWVGLDLAAWAANANPDGLDSLAARSHIANVYTGAGGYYDASSLTASARYDVWTSGPFIGYGVANIGVNRSGGYLMGNCSHSHYPDPCETEPVGVDTPGWTPAGRLGAGLLVHLFDVKNMSSFVPSRLFVEANVANQGSRDGRLTMMPLQLGIAWSW